METLASILYPYHFGCLRNQTTETSSQKTIVVAWLVMPDYGVRAISELISSSKGSGVEKLSIDSIQELPQEEYLWTIRYRLEANKQGYTGVLKIHTLEFRTIPRPSATKRIFDLLTVLVKQHRGPGTEHQFIQ